MSKNLNLNNIERIIADSIFLIDNDNLIDIEFVLIQDRSQ